MRIIGAAYKAPAMIGNLSFHIFILSLFRGSTSRQLLKGFHARILKNSDHGDSHEIPS